MIKQNYHSTYRVCTLFVGVLLTLLIGMPGATVSAAEVLLVPDHYPTIQDAHDAANPEGGDTIIIGPGEFAGALITKSVNNPYVGIGADFSDGLTISGSTFNDPYVGIGSFYREGLTISGSTTNYPNNGLGASYSDGLTISDSTFKNSYRAIDIRNTSDCEVLHNRVLGLKADPNASGFISHSDGIFLGETNDCVVAHNYVWHNGDRVGGYDEEFYVGIALASLGLPAEGNNFHHNRVEVSVNWDGEPVSVVEWSGAHVFADYGVVDYGLPISVKNNKLMHNNFLGSDQGELFYPAEVADYNKAKHNLFDE